MPQFSPAIIESCGPGSSTISPASIDASAQAARVGSTPRMNGRFGVSAEDVPPIGETIPGFELVGWQGIMVPKDTPRDIVMNLNAALNKVLQEDELIAFTRSGNLELAGGTPEAFGEKLKRDYEMYGRITREAKIEPQ